MKMRKYLIALVASLFLTLVITPSKTIAAPELTTKEEIMAFQKSKGLKADGIMGPKTRAALRAETQPKSKKKTAAILPPREPCHFLVWEVECAGNVKSTFNDTIPTSDAFLPSFIKNAKTEIGLNAKTDRQKLKTELSQANKQTVDPAFIPWCAAWANKVLADAGMPGTDSLMARSFLAWGHPVSGVPKVGDVVVMRRGRNRYAGHVGFFYGFVDDATGIKKVAVLGGNQGESVSISYYPISRVIAYRTI
jgi:uncharacterized protein (TIGR02594 family)